MQVRVPLAVDLNIERFAGGVPSRIGSYMQNAVADVQKTDPNIVQIITQRPAFDLFEDPESESVTDNRGRGIYFWEANSTRYIVNNDTVYRGDYGTSVGSISAGTSKVYFAEVGVRLYIIDPENDEAWSITTGHTLAQVTDAQFPTDIVPGGTELNDYLYVMDSAGVIYNSANGDGTAYDAADFLLAERENDAGIFLGKHHDHIVAFKSSTIEFFFDAGNPTGSPLTRRPDIFYSIGCASGFSVWIAGDIIYFVGTDAKGGIGVYKLENFKITKISHYGIDSYLTSILTNSSFSAVGSGFSAQGKTFYILTSLSVGDDLSSLLTLVYDSVAHMWGIWTTGISAVDVGLNLPIVSSTIYRGTAPRTVESITLNGSLLAINDLLFPVDTFGVDIYVAEGYWEFDYTSDTLGQSNNIEMLIRTGLMDGGTSDEKYVSSVQVVGDHTDEEETAILRWSNDTHSNYANISRTVNLNRKDKASRCGRFKRRTWQLEYEGDEQLRLEALDIEARKGST